MAARGAAKDTPIDQGIVARVAGAVRGAIRGASEAWFGPGEPMRPQAPEATRGRQFDYPFAVNQLPAPRGEQGENAISFATLRALADPTQGGLDLIRLAIEKRKNQMEAQHWNIVGRDEQDGGARADEIKKALRKPDGENTYRVWQRMLLEDLLVIDAPCIYHAPRADGSRTPQIMDGALLKRLVSEDGRTPLPPEPAFQQHLKGMPAVEYSLEELTYAPRNKRSHRIYGMSQVEQVVMIVNIALRRQVHQLEYYTAGSIPDMLLGTPENWTADQIRQFQEFFDAKLRGNTSERRGIQFVPGGMQPVPTKDQILKDLFDEWLARIICFCFDLPPQALVKETNRSTSETNKESAQEEGLEPLKLWFKDVMDEVLEKDFNAPELEFVFVDEEIADPVAKANVVSLATGKKAWLTQDEAREMYGKAPLTPEQQLELNPPPPPQLGPGPDEQAAIADTQAKAEAALELLKVERGAEPIHALAAAVVDLAKAHREKAPPRRIVKFTRDPKTRELLTATEGEA